jgi:phosphinothricin acetyltransferase
MERWVSRFSFRPALLSDAPLIAAIYNQGIEDRVATFETEPRSAATIEAWFEVNLPIVVVVDENDDVIAFAALFGYSDRCVYAGIAEFSVYVRRDVRGLGAGKVAMSALLDAAAAAGLWKLLSRVFPENAGSLALLRGLGFREVGLHERHGKLDGHWRDVVLVERLISENQNR